MYIEDDFVLYMAHAKLTEIPLYNETIKKLDLRRNLIRNIDLTSSIAIDTIDLSDNKITKIKDLWLVPNLAVLDLSYNLITNVDIPICNLRELYLIGNDIASIRNLELPSLKILDIAGNALQDITGFDQCKNLQELYLGCNQIEHVIDITHFDKLQTLDLQSNDLRVIDCKLLPRSLKQLLLGDNKNLTTLIDVHMLHNLEILGVERTKIQNVKSSGSVWYR